MVKWNYVQDVKKEKAEAFCEKSMKRARTVIENIICMKLNITFDVEIVRSERMV